MNKQSSGTLIIRNVYFAPVPWCIWDYIRPECRTKEYHFCHNLLKEVYFRIRAFQHGSDPKSVTLDYGPRSGSGSGSCSSLQWFPKMPTQNCFFFSLSFFAYYLHLKFTTVFKDNNLLKVTKMQKSRFFIVFCLLIVGSGSKQKMEHTDPVQWYDHLDPN